MTARISDSDGRNIYNVPVIERWAVFILGVLGLAGLGVAPWAAINRETGARSAVVLLPDRVFDFTGRTGPVQIEGQLTVLILSVIALLMIAVASWLPRRPRSFGWLVAGALLIVVQAWGLAMVGQGVNDARIALLQQEIRSAIDEPRDTYDVPTLQRLVDRAPETGVESTLTAAADAGLRIRRLPFAGSGFGLAAFLALVAGGAAILFGLRIVPRLDRAIGRIVQVAAVPLTSILLALVAAAVVVLALQPTPLGRGVEIAGPFMDLVGRLDTLWYAYLTLFSDSLGSFAGFAEALKFATPLIFTGLAVAFGFQAGLFNIGAPGQMVLGAIFAMLVGIYLPGPKVFVLPMAVLAAAVGGGLWGALPGWLKAQFGANEVINTILLNFVASALLLFILSSTPVFAAGALRVIYVLGIAALIAVVLSIFRPVRKRLGRSPRLTLAIFGVLLLGAVVAAAWPQPGDGPVQVQLPFKVPGSEPKSQPLSEAARLPQLPALFGFDPAVTIGAQQTTWNAALVVALAALALTFFVSRRVGMRRWWTRLPAAIAVGGVAYLVAALFGGTAVPVTVPPSKLNFSFVIAIAAAVFMQYFLWRTKWGYELRAVGLAPKAAEYGGASIARNVVLAMTISGAFAGLTATHYVLGGALEEYSLRQSLPTNDGFDGIAVALLGANSPVGIVASAFLFGVLKNGGSQLNITFPDLTRDVVNMILALVVLFIAARGFLPDRMTDPLHRMAVAPELDPETSEPVDGTGDTTHSALGDRK